MAGQRGTGVGRLAVVHRLARRSRGRNRLDQVEPLVALTGPRDVHSLAVGGESGSVLAGLRQDDLLDPAQATLGLGHADPDHGQGLGAARAPEAQMQPAVTVRRERGCLC